MMIINHETYFQIYRMGQKYVLYSDTQINNYQRTYTKNFNNILTDCLILNYMINSIIPQDITLTAEALLSYKLCKCPILKKTKGKL